MTNRTIACFVAGMLLGLAALEAGAVPTAAPGGVRFTFDAPGAGQVFIAGGFNGWAPTQDAMTRVEGSGWEITLALKPGRYEYKFVVDGKTWTEDPTNPLYVPDPYGGKNSVVIVRDDGSLDFQGKLTEGSVAPIVASLPAYPKPLHLAILWHQHQPRYFKDPVTGEYLEPWVRIHGIKDYYDMAAMLEAYPKIKFTINLTPVLLSQLEEMIAAYAAAKDQGALTPGRRPGYIPGCDIWVRLTLTPPESLAYEEKALILRNYFRMPRETMIDIYPRFRELALKKKGDSDKAIRETVTAFTDADWRDLQAWFNLAEFDPGFKEGEVVLADGRKVSVAHLIAKSRDFTEADKAEIIDAQFKILENIIPIHRRLQDQGRLEVITSPFYHPILPLLCDTDVAREADPGLALPEKRFAYPQDAAAQVGMACDFYEARFGKRPRGMWPSEGSVSEAILPIVAAAGIGWLASDEDVLARSLGIDRAAPEAKYRCYAAGAPVKQVGLVFRDHRLSDDIGFRYARINGVEAANDLLKKLHDIHTAIQGLDGDFVVPIIMDGENAWENFQRDGKEFLNSLYSQVSEAPWLVSVTISAYFDQVPPAPLAGLAPGSWITPNFNTWIGESEENTAWTYLAQARAAVDAGGQALDAEADRRVMTEVYAAEGSDWFWWYGLDQGSGNDESFDRAFRGTLARIYQILGVRPPQYLSVPIIAPPARRPDVPITGVLSPTLDGALGEPLEWDRAAYIEDSSPREGAAVDLIRGLYYGYDAENLWLRIDAGASPDTLAALGSNITVYFSGKDDLAAEAYAEVQPGGPEHAFGFGITSKLDILIDSEGISSVFSKADGQGGWVRQVTLPIEAGRTIEVAVPFALLELATGDELRFGVVARSSGRDEDLLPDQGFVAFKAPPLGGVSYVKTLEDPRGDDHGPGTYVYPSDPVFVEGAFDITSLEVMLDGEANVIFKLVLRGEITCPWGGLTGYSLQAVDIYIDTDGLPDSGRRDLFKARRARTASENAWEYFVRASMDTVAIYDREGRRLDGVKVTSYADAATSSIFVKLPRSAIGPAVSLNLIVALLGHDGYGDGGIRPVKAAREQWVFGGCDQEALCPAIIDLVVGGGASQEDVLAAYKTAGKLVEIPAIRVVFP
jgi:alpha-amylase/alpha-mannosidase (GH57 family)